MARTSQNAKTQLLQSVGLFEHCSRRQLTALAKVADELEAPSGKELVQQGSAGRELFVLVEGAARVDRDGQTLAELGPGDHFGEMSLLDGEPRSASVTLTEDSHLLVIGSRAFKPLLADVPGFAERLLATMSGRLRAADTSLAKGL